MNDHSPHAALLAEAEAPTEALPHRQRYAGRTFAAEYGGDAVGDPHRQRDFADEVVLPKARGRGRRRTVSGRCGWRRG